MKSEVEVMAVRPEEDDSEDEEGGKVEVETDAERLRAKKSKQSFEEGGGPEKTRGAGGERSLPHLCSLPQLVSMLCESEGEWFGPSEGSRWRKRS